MPWQGGPGGGLFDMLGTIAGPMLTGRRQGSGQGGGIPFDILKQIGSAIFSGRGRPNVGGSGTTATGAGALSMLGAVAAQALEVAKQMMSGGPAGGGAPTGSTPGGFDFTKLGVSQHAVAYLHQAVGVA